MDLSSGSSAAPLQLDGPPWHAPTAKRQACARAWSAHFQPLIREISHLLTCVPGALPFEELGGWDQRTYCKTLAGLVAFLEHHACWATLAALLRHAGQYGVRLCYQGQRMSEPIASGALQALLQGAKHEDVSVMFLPDTEQERMLRAQRQQLQMLQNSSKPVDDFGDIFVTCHNMSLPPSLRTSSTGEGRSSRAPDTAVPDADGAGSETDDSGDLASEFSNWRQQWLTRGFSGTLNKIATGSPSTPMAGTALSFDSQPPFSGDKVKLTTVPSLVAAVAGATTWTPASGLVPNHHHVSASREVLMVILACAAVAIYAMFL